MKRLRRVRLDAGGAQHPPTGGLATAGVHGQRARDVRDRAVAAVAALADHGLERRDDLDEERVHQVRNDDADRVGPPER
jgi:hypothetical protein